MSSVIGNQWGEHKSGRGVRWSGWRVCGECVAASRRTSPVRTRGRSLLIAKVNCEAPLAPRATPGQPMAAANCPSDTRWTRPTLTYGCRNTSAGILLYVAL